MKIPIILLPCMSMTIYLYGVMLCEGLITPLEVVYINGFLVLATPLIYLIAYCFVKLINRITLTKE